MPLVDPYNSLRVPPSVVHEFVGVFARFEHAMKEGGFRRNEHGRAAAAWTRLINDVGAWVQVAPDSELDIAVQYLNNEPPQIQVFVASNEGESDWQEVALEGKGRVARAVDASRRVRNNLFHGGKYNPERYPGRDERLVRSALMVLLAVAEQGPLSHGFNGFV